MNARQRYYKRSSGNPRLNRQKKGVIFVAGAVLGTVGLAIIFFALSHALGRSDFFQITAIDIRGCEKTSKRQILEYSGADIHSNLFSLDADEVKARVESSQWVHQADIEKKWPNELAIIIKERAPVAMVSLEGTLRYVDLEGVVFAEVLPPAEMDYPVVTGLPARVTGDPEKEHALGEALRFIDYASKGNPYLPVQTSLGQFDMGGINRHLIKGCIQGYPPVLWRPRLPRLAGQHGRGPIRQDSHVSFGPGMIKKPPPRVDQPHT